MNKRIETGETPSSAPLDFTNLPDSRIGHVSHPGNTCSSSKPPEVMRI